MNLLNFTLQKYKKFSLSKNIKPNIFSASLIIKTIKFKMLKESLPKLQALISPFNIGIILHISI